MDDTNKKVVARILKNEGKHEILEIMGEKPLELIETAGRVAYQSDEKREDGSAEKFVRMIRSRGHESVLEHSSMTVLFNNVSRGFTHELVRHRLASFTQESTRYVDESNLKVVIPPDKDPDEKLVKLKIGKEYYDISFQEWVEMNEQMYRGLKEAGWMNQDARQILPIGIKSQIVVTCNFREWRHIFELRCSKAAHWEIRRVTLNLLIEVQKRIPAIFDDFKIYRDYAEKA